MCDFDQHAKDLVELIDKLKADRVVIHSAQTVTDKNISHCYHIIELLPLSASELSKVLKKLKALLILRREIKEKIAKSDSMLNSKVCDIKPFDAKSAERVLRYKAEALEAYNEFFGVSKTLKKVV